MLAAAVLATTASSFAEEPAEAVAKPASCERSVQYILRGQYDAALRQLEGARSGGNSSADIENLSGLAVLLDGDPAKAIPYFDRALALDPKLSAARMNRAVALLRTGNFAVASTELETLWKDEDSPYRGEAAYHNGIALDRLGRAADAELWLQRAASVDQRLDGALLYIGMLRERAGDLQGAGRAYRDYLAVHPDSPAALLRFGLSAAKSGRSDVAKKYFARLLETAPDSSEAIEARKMMVMWE